MRYEIVNPFDPCYIHTENEQVAKVAMVVLSGGWYGLKDESGTEIMRGRNLTTEDVYEAAGLPRDCLWVFARDFAAELAAALGSFEYDGEHPRVLKLAQKAAACAAECRRRAER